MEGNTTQNISEHLPMVIAENEDAIVLSIILFGILIFTKTKISLSDLFMIGGLFCLMLITRRQLSMFVLIGSTIFGKLICEAFECYKKGSIQKLTDILLKVIPMGIIVTVILVCSYDLIKEKSDDEYVSKSLYPVDASTFILENIDLDEAKFYNEYNYGSYMLFRGIPVFIDSRADLYAPEFSGLEDDIFTDFLNISGINTFYTDMFEKYEMTHLIAYQNSKLNMLIENTKDTNYIKLYEDDYFVIYEIVGYE